MCVSLVTIYNDKYFASVFTTDDQGSLPKMKNIFLGEDNEKLCTFRVSSDMVRMKLSKLTRRMAIANKTCVSGKN